MTVKIDQKITGYKVKAEDAVEAEAKVETMHEGVDRPEVLSGKTYKVKPPGVEDAMYITINDLILSGVRHPYEIFINCKNMEHFPWVLALTRVLSAVFRKGGDIQFLSSELLAVFDPKGGHRRKGGRYMNSMVAEIGRVLEEHLATPTPVDQHMLDYIEAKKLELGGIPDTAQNCGTCGERALVLMDGCLTCLACGQSKCS